MEEGRIPIVIDGEISGYVDIASRGAVTEFDAKCRMREGIVRLSVYGELEEGYLGVMVPDGEYLALKKRMTRLQMKDFPAKAIEAGISGRGGAGAQHEKPPEEEKNIVIDDLVWYSSPEGVLVSFDGERSLAAFRPGCEPVTEAVGCRREIDGQEYMVYIIRNGRIAQQ